MENTVKIDKKNQVPSLLEDYEDGEIATWIYTEKKWWQFWKPAIIYGYIRYVRIGNIMNIQGIPPYFLKT